MLAQRGGAVFVEQHSEGLLAGDIAQVAIDRIQVAGQGVGAQPHGQFLRRLEANHGQVIVRLSEIPGAQTNYFI